MNGGRKHYLIVFWTSFVTGVTTPFLLGASTTMATHHITQLSQPSRTNRSRMNARRITYDSHALSLTHSNHLHFRCVTSSTHSPALHSISWRNALSCSHTHFPSSHPTTAGASRYRSTSPNGLGSEEWKEQTPRRQSRQGLSVRRYGEHCSDGRTYDDQGMTERTEQSS